MRNYYDITSDGWNPLGRALVWACFFILFSIKTMSAGMLSVMGLNMCSTI